MMACWMRLPQPRESPSSAVLDDAAPDGLKCGRPPRSPVLAQQTPVILLDEPTAALDIRHQEQVLGLVRLFLRVTEV